METSGNVDPLAGTRRKKKRVIDAVRMFFEEYRSFRGTGSNNLCFGARHHVRLFKGARGLVAFANGRVHDDAANTDPPSAELEAALKIIGGTFVHVPWREDLVIQAGESLFANERIIRVICQARPVQPTAGPRWAALFCTSSAHGLASVIIMNEAAVVITRVELPGEDEVAHVGKAQHAF